MFYRLRQPADFVVAAGRCSLHARMAPGEFGQLPRHRQQGRYDKSHQSRKHGHRNSDREQIAVRIT